MKKKYYPIFLVLGALPVVLAAPAWSADRLATQRLRVAISQCEKGLKAPAPQSQTALQVLKRYQEKYERYKEAASKRDLTVIQSSEPYNGQSLNSKTYAQVIATCDAELAAKVTQAETHVNQRMEQHKARQAQLESKEAKLAAAKLQISTAINRYCGAYVSPPAAQNLDPEAEKIFDNDFKSYKTTRQMAVTIYPDIVKEKHQALAFDQAAGAAKDTTKTVQAWFEYCDAVFPTYKESLNKALESVAAAAEAAPADEGEAPVDAEAEVEVPADAAGAVEDTAAPAETTTPPVAPKEPAPAAEELAPAPPVPATPHAPKEHAPPPKPAAPAPAAAEEPPADTAAGGDEDAEMLKEQQAELKKFLKGLKGDRVKVATDEKRIPDFTPDNDDPKKANLWQYESEVGGKLKCKAYTFQDDKLVNTKPSNGECQ